jgi:DNA repair REX1-B
MTFYPDACSKATASFSVLSETIKAVQDILNKDPSRSHLARLVSQLQAREKEKLHLTAAYHLERIRHQNHQVHPEKDHRIDILLGDGVRSIQIKINACVEMINEIVEEIRFALFEED